MIRVSEGPKLRQVPLSAPHGVRVEHLEFGISTFHGNLPDSAVVLGISAVHVAHHTSAEQSMVES